MITTDREDRIVTWSTAAQRLLGFAPEQVMGRRFFEALGARDSFGNRFCGRACAYHDMVRAGEPVHTFEMQITDARGVKVRTFVSIAAEGGRRSAGRLVYHLRADLRRQEERRRTTDRRRLRVRARHQAPAGPDSPSSSSGLSPRELQVLRCLASGGGTDDIAVELGISAVTVRNHVQNLLRKLGAHGRLEAVTLALQQRLI